MQQVPETRPFRKCNCFPSVRSSLIHSERAISVQRAQRLRFIERIFQTFINLTGALTVSASLSLFRHFALRAPNARRGSKTKSKN